MWYFRGGYTQKVSRRGKNSSINIIITTTYTTGHHCPVPVLYHPVIPYIQGTAGHLRDTTVLLCNLLLLRSFIVFFRASGTLSPFMGLLKESIKYRKPKS